MDSIFLKSRRSPNVLPVRNVHKGFIPDRMICLLRGKLVMFCIIFKSNKKLFCTSFSLKNSCVKRKKFLIIYHTWNTSSYGSLKNILFRLLIVVQEDIPCGWSNLSNKKLRLHTSPNPVACKTLLCRYFKTSFSRSKMYEWITTL